MSLRKSPTMTAARLAANRLNAKKSTGPRTARGKAHSRMNGLRSGSRSHFYLGLWRALLEAPPCSVDRTARAVLTPELAAHRLFARAVDIFRQAEIDIVLEARINRERQQQRSLTVGRPPNQRAGSGATASVRDRVAGKAPSIPGTLKNDDRSLNVVENTRHAPIAPDKYMKTEMLT